MNLLLTISCILGGVLLAIDTLDKWDGDKNFFKKISAFALPYNTIIGGILLGLSTFYLITGGCFLYNIIAILAGLLLLSGALTKIPVIGNLLVNASKALVPFKVIIGLSILFIGISKLIGFNLFC